MEKKHTLKQTPHVDMYVYIFMGWNFEKLTKGFSSHWASIAMFLQPP